MQNIIIRWLSLRSELALFASLFIAIACRITSLK